MAGENTPSTSRYTATDSYTHTWLSLLFPLLHRTGLMSSAAHDGQDFNTTLTDAHSTSSPRPALIDSPFPDESRFDKLTIKSNQYVFLNSVL